MKAVAAFASAGALDALSAILWGHSTDHELCHHACAALDSILRGLPKKDLTNEDGDEPKTSVPMEDPIAALVCAVHVQNAEVYHLCFICLALVS